MTVTTIMMVMMVIMMKMLLLMTMMTRMVTRTTSVSPNACAALPAAGVCLCGKISRFQTAVLSG